MVYFYNKMLFELDELSESELGEIDNCNFGVFDVWKY